jgi:hypothetical protein
MVCLVPFAGLRRLAVPFSRSRLRVSTHAHALACLTRCLEGDVSMLPCGAMTPLPIAMAMPSAFWAVWVRCSQHL